MMQPYAWLFAHGHLHMDDRVWSTPYRGIVFIHASRRFHEPYYRFLTERAGWTLPAPEAFPSGGVVGVGVLAQCRPRTPHPGDGRWVPDLGRSHLGAPGHYGLVLEDCRPLPFVPCRGERGLFEPPAGARTVLENLLTQHGIEPRDGA